MSRGSTIMCSIVFGSAVLFSYAAYEDSRPMPVPPHGEEHVLHNLEVLALGVDGFHYEFRDERSIEFWVHFCQDEEPQFSPGMTLNVLTYRDFGGCWSIKDTHPAYLIKRDKKGRILKENFYDRSQNTPAR